MAQEGLYIVCIYIPGYSLFKHIEVLFEYYCAMQGLVQSLDGLNIRHNPLEFPPTEVLQKGTQKMLSFLRRLLQAKSEASKTG